MPPGMVTESERSCGVDWSDGGGTCEVPVVFESSVLIVLLRRTGSAVLDLFERGVRMDDDDGCMMSEFSSSSMFIASGDDDNDDESSDIGDELIAVGCVRRDEPISESSTMLPPSSRSACALQRDVGAREVDATSVLLCSAAGADTQSVCQRPSTFFSLHAKGHTLHRNERKLPLDPLLSQLWATPILQWGMQVATGSMGLGFFAADSLSSHAASAKVMLLSGSCVNARGGVHPSSSIDSSAIKVDCCDCCVLPAGGRYAGGPVAPI